MCQLDIAMVAGQRSGTAVLHGAMQTYSGDGARFLKKPAIASYVHQELLSFTLWRNSDNGGLDRNFVAVLQLSFIERDNQCRRAPVFGGLYLIDVPKQPLVARELHALRRCDGVSKLCGYGFALR